jgi:hypothetical protein
MCMFCAAIPATAAIGINLNTKQKANRQAAEKEGTAPPTEMPIMKVTAGLVVLLTVGSLVYHSIIFPIWKI